MKTNLRLKSLFMVSILSFLALTCFALSINFTTGYAATSVENAVVTMQHGARVRAAGIKDGKNGISWQLNMDGQMYNDVENENVSYGVLIAPAEYGLSKESVFGENKGFWWITEDGEKVGNTETGKQIWNLETETLAEKNGVRYFNASLVNIHESNIAREFIGVGYLKYTVGGTDNYIFAEDNSNARTMTYVALRYLESAENTFDAQQERDFRAQYVKEVPVSVTFNIAGEEQTKAVSLAVSETYTANDLAKIADVSLDGLIKSADGLSSIKIANDTAEITNVKFEAVGAADLAGTYSLPNGTVKLGFDGSASITSGGVTTHGNWKIAFDKDSYSNVALVALDDANSFSANIEKTESAYALTMGGATYAQTASTIKTLYQDMKGNYKIYYKYTSGTEVYANGVEIRNYNGFEEIATSGLGTANNFSATPINGTYGSYTGSTSGNGKGYYAKINGKYYLFHQAANNSLYHYGFAVQGGAGSRLDDTLEDAIYAKLAGNYSYTNGQGVVSTIGFTSDLISSLENGTASTTKGGRYGNGRQVVAGSKINTTALQSVLDLVFLSENVGWLYIRQTANNGNMTPGKPMPFFIAGDQVVFADNSVAGYIFVKGENTTNDGYLSAIKTFISGKYVLTNGVDLEIKSDGTAKFNGKDVTYTINPERSLGSDNVSSPRSIYKGQMVITFADNSAYTLNYDFSNGRTAITGIAGMNVNALQIG